MKTLIYSPSYDFGSSHLSPSIWLYYQRQKFFSYNMILEKREMCADVQFYSTFPKQSWSNTNATPGPWSNNYLSSKWSSKSYNAALLLASTITSPGAVTPVVPVVRPPVTIVRPVITSTVTTTAPLGVCWRYPSWDLKHHQDDSHCQPKHVHQGHGHLKKNSRRILGFKKKLTMKNERFMVHSGLPFSSNVLLIWTYKMYKIHKRLTNLEKIHRTVATFFSLQQRFRLQATIDDFARRQLVKCACYWLCQQPWTFKYVNGLRCCVHDAMLRSFTAFASVLFSIPCMKEKRNSWYIYARRRAEWVHMMPINRDKHFQDVLYTWIYSLSFLERTTRVSHCGLRGFLAMRIHLRSPASVTAF